MTSFYLSFPGAILIQIKSSEDLELSKILLGAYVPGSELVVGSDLTPDVIIEYEQSDDKRLVQEENIINIYDNWKKEFPLDFYHLLYSVLRTELLKRELFPVHAACIGKNEYILIVGHTGAGKTSIVLELLKDKNVRLLSGNKTVVAFRGVDLEAFAGTSTLTIGIEDTKHHLDGEVGIVKYGERAAVTSKQYTNNSGRIRAIVLPSLNDGVSENKILNPTSALHRLYAYFLDVVNADTILCDGRGVYVGTPPTGVQDKLAKNLKNVLSKIPTYSTKGSMEFVCDSITKI